MNTERFTVRNAAGEVVGHVDLSPGLAREARDDIIRRAWEMEQIQAELEQLISPEEEV